MSNIINSKTEEEASKQLESLKTEMVSIDKIISKLPDFPSYMTHSLEKFLLNTVDLAPASPYRKDCANKVNQLMDIIDKIEELKNSVTPKHF